MVGAFGEAPDDGSPSVWIGECGEGGRGSALVGLSRWGDLVGKAGTEIQKKKAKQLRKRAEKVSPGVEKSAKNR